MVKSEQRATSQTAYHVMVASTAEKLEQGEGDLWDTGKVASSATFGVSYEGEPLRSGQRCYWKVRVWDEQRRPSAWSQTASWEMGLLDESDWTADWIGFDADRTSTNPLGSLSDAKWVLHGEDRPGGAPKGSRLYVKRFTLPSGSTMLSGEALVIADNKHWFSVNSDVLTHGESGWKTGNIISIADALQPGENELRIRVENDAPGPSGVLAKVVIQFADGESMTIVTDDSWRSTNEPQENWSARELGPQELQACQAVGDYGSQPWGQTAMQWLHLPPAPLLRTEFDLEKQPVKAILYATALGIVDTHLNGELVSKERFTPGWTDYDKRVYYRAYDVTDRLRVGANALGAELADGWYSGYIGWGRRRDHYGTEPRVRMQLHVAYEDGSTDVFGTDSSWKATTGPTREADFLMGETYDARLEYTEWSEPDFDDEAWRPVVRGADAPGIVESHPAEPVVVVKELKPTAITEPTPGAYVVDLGQNIAGVVRLKVQGKPGQRIQLRFAERLNPDGTIYTANLRGARAIDTYICRGGDETWAPRFTFHGFQYVEVTGLNAPPDETTITGLPLSTDTPRVGSFACSDPMLNRLVKNIYWTQRANFIDIPTDCPQRDERLGWTGDAQVYIAAACLQTDSQAFFRKWLVDLRDAQRADGQFPRVAPLKVTNADGGPAWADAGVICPWELYRTYGDERLLRRNYPSMKRFIEFCHDRSTGDLLPPEKYHCFGDWLSINADTPHDVIYTAYFAYCTRLLARSAEVLGYEKDAEKYRRLADRIKQAFNDAYVREDGTIHGDTQCAYAMALSYDLLDADKSKLAAKHLIEDIESRGNHLSTGFVGTKDLMLALAKIGRNDIAYRLIHQDTFPSWGFSIRHGATSIWERWDGWTPDNGFQAESMNSFAHYSFGAVYRWMVENIAGIQNGGDAYKRVIFAPSLDDKLDWVEVSYDSLRGKIRSSWKRTPGQLKLNVSLPSNTTGVLHVPQEYSGDLTEGGKPANGASGVLSVTEQGEGYVVRLGSGDYSFVAKRSD